jgi:Smr domain
MKTSVRVSTSTTWSSATRSQQKPTVDEMDAYVQRVLEQASSEAAVDGENCVIDDSLGPYVTSCLRNSNAVAVADVTAIPDFESLCELLQEHCRIEEDAAANILKRIADAVFSDRVPIDVSSLDETDFRSLTLSTVQDDQELQQQPHAVLSPLAADNLLPVDLLEEDDDEGDDQVLQGTAASSPPGDNAAFPPLGAQSESSKTSTKKTKIHPPKSHHHHHSKLEKSAAADELAAALFRPSRSRQSSIDESSPNLHAVTATLQPPSIPEQPPMHYNPYSNKNEEQQRQLDNVAEILLTMNNDLSEDAAFAAALLAGADMNIAQYIIEQAAAQLPVCRHLLADGCYRADCAFSHDIDSHTCLFWLRTRCGKGSQCRFLHGFAEKLLENLPEDLYTAYNDTTSNADNYYGGQQHQHEPSAGYHDPQHQQQYGDYSSTYGAYGNAAPANSSWIPSPPPSSNSFANIASQGYNTRQSFGNDTGTRPAQTTTATIPVASIPQDLWNPHENRDAAAFYIADPLERYYAVTAAIGVPRDDVIDLHFQSLKTFRAVLETVLPTKLQTQPQVWIITGTGHHVGSRTHQKGGGALEAAVLEYLTTNTEYAVSRGRDRNGQGGAVLVQKQRR